MKFIKSIGNLIYFIFAGHSSKYKFLNKYLYKNNDRDIINKMALDYNKLSIEDKYYLELRMKDIIADIDKLSFLSVFIVFFIPIINIILSDDKFFRVAVFFGMLIFIGHTLIVLTSYYKTCKLYLEVIDCIKHKVITFEGCVVKKVKYNDIYKTKIGS